MIPTKVIFFVIMIIQGQSQPTRFDRELPSLAECIFEVHEFMVKPSHELLIRGGQLQVGCVTAFPPSEEH